MRSVLYLGCPPSERAETEKVLATGNVSVVWADDAGHVLGELQRREMPVLLDLSRGPAAMREARQLRAQRPGMLMFAVVDSRRPELTTEAVLTGVADVFARPPAAHRLATAIDRTWHDDSAHRALEMVSRTLYSRSPSMRTVVALISRAATMRAGVMIRGEDGCGRNVVARTIHSAQPDAITFVSVDCAARDADELETELFGTAAQSTGGSFPRLESISQNSRVYRAVGGTLYLENIAAASARVQGRLARVLRDREAILVETGSRTALDVRPIAAVDPAGDRAVEEGRVRDDLFKRLSVLRIDVPPLRSRREDIPDLANHFLREICPAAHVLPKALSAPAMALIAALPWRGNAAELRTTLEKIVAGLGSRRGIGLEDVLTHVRLDSGSSIDAHGTLRQARARFEREYIKAVLEQKEGRVSHAAKVLGIQRTNLYRKIRSLGLERAK